MKLKLKQFLALILVVVSTSVIAQTPTLIGSATFQASGSGASGIPTINYNIPAGNKRLMVVSMFVERNHGTTASNSNWPNNPDGTLPVNTTANIISVGGLGTTNLEYRENYYQSPAGAANVRLSTHYLFNYLSDAQSLPTGSTNITFPGMILPENAGDEMTIVIEVFANANQVPQNLGSIRENPFSATSLSFTGTAPTPPIGTANTNVLYLANGYLSQQGSALTFTAGWTSTANISNNNTNGTTLVGVGYANEQDGTRFLSAYRSGLTVNPTFQWTRSGTVEISRACNHIYAILPLARPSVTGTVYRDNNGLTGGINNGGGGGVWNTANALWVNAVDTDGNVVATALVNASGVFSFPTGGNLIEGDVIRFELSKNQGVVGSLAPAKELPSNWLTVGESIASGTSDGTPNGEFTLTIGTANSPNNTTNRFGVVACAAGTAAPVINATAQYSNINFSYTIPCGSLTANLSTLTASNTPAGTSITWHTGSTATDANKVSPVIAIGGTTKLYAAFYDATLSCYSPTREVTVYAPICATNDDYSATPIIAGVGGTLPSIFGNDTYNGNNIALLPANSVQFLYELWTPANATVNGTGGLTIPSTVLPGIYTYTYKICDIDPDAVSGSSCSIATVTFVVEVDSDGDGVVDSLDLDDDNDGILDTDECAAVNTVTNGDFPVNLSGWTVGTGWYRTAANKARNDTDGVVNSILSQTINNLDRLSNGVLTVSLEIGAGDLNNASGQTATLDIMVGGVVYATITNGTARNTSNVTANLASGVTSNFVTFGTSGVTGLTFRNVTFNIPYSGSSTALLAFRMNGGGDDWAVSNIVVNVCSDTDGDGIPNYLDLDSDGDGCPDAIEGGATFTTSNLVTSTMAGGNLGTSYNGLSTASVTQNLGNTVGSTPTTIGVPTIAGTGQAVGQSQNGFKNDCQDSDLDGIGDWEDLDDDNDGILDTAECTTTVNDFITAFGAGTTTDIFPSDFGLALNVKNQNVSADLSAKFGYPANSGAVIVSITNASVHPTANVWWTKNGEQPSIWKVTGTMSAFVGMAHDVQYYANDSKTFHIYDNADVIPVTAAGFANQTAVAGQWSVVDTQSQKTLNNLNANGGTIEIANWRYINMNFGAKSFGFSTTVASGNPNYGVTMLLECDTDGDGIPDRLDLDSDNDGCLDAIEGGAAITNSQLVNSGGTVTVGIGSSANNQNLCAGNTCVDANGIPTIAGTGQTVGDSQNAAVSSQCSSACYKPGIIDAGNTYPTKHGVTALQRAGSDNDNWPMVRQSAWTVLESKEKGFVVNRVATTAGLANITNPVEGMMVYDEEADCLKIYTLKSGDAAMAWHCFTTPACPD